MRTLITDQLSLLVGAMLESYVDLCVSLKDSQEVCK